MGRDEIGLSKGVVGDHVDVSVRRGCRALRSGGNAGRGRRGGRGHLGGARVAAERAICGARYEAARAICGCLRSDCDEVVRVHTLDESSRLLDLRKGTGQIRIRRRAADKMTRGRQRRGERRQGWLVQKSAAGEAEVYGLGPGLGKGQERERPRDGGGATGFGKQGGKALVARKKGTRQESAGRGVAVAPIASNQPCGSPLAAHWRAPTPRWRESPRICA